MLEEHKTFETRNIVFQQQILFLEQFCLFSSSNLNLNDRKFDGKARMEMTPINVVIFWLESAHCKRFLTCARLGSFIKKTSQFDI